MHEKRRQLRQQLEQSSGRRFGRNRAHRQLLYHRNERLFYSHSTASVLPSRHSSCTQFSIPSRAECRQITPCRVSSPSGTEAGTPSKIRLKLRALSFRFLSQTALRMAPADSIVPKTSVSKLNCPLARMPSATTTGESSEVACSLFAKPQVAGLRHW